MCGICGELVLHHGERVSPDTLAAMRSTLEHRGPDGAGLFLSADGAVGFGFRRLRIIDLSPTADQPMGNEDGAIQVMLNGEIYNFRELRAELCARGHRFRSHSDTETIVHLYEDEGTDAIRRLDGMFALAIWDGRLKRLVLARDGAGKKPLFVYRDARRLAFASEMKALFANAAIPIEIDADSIPVYFARGHVPCPRTLYRGIAQVPPGSVMTIDGDGATTSTTYWQLPGRSEDRTLHRTAPVRKPVVREEATRQVVQLVTRAVEKRLVSDVPLGAFLSGGLDSTIIVGLMARLTGSRVKTFSIGFEGDDRYDETRYARMAARRFGTEHTEFHVSPRAIDLIDPLIWQHDGPFGDSSAVPTYLVARLTRQHVTVALSGDGGDELFAGYLRFQAAVVAERVPRFAASLLRAALAIAPHPRNERHWLARARRFARFLDLPLSDRLDSWSSPFLQNVDALLAPAFRPSVGDGVPRRRDVDERSSLSPLARALRHNFESYLLDDLLVKADRCAMANSLEVRSPFLDRELTEYVMALPDRYKLTGWHRKVILTDAFADLVPTEILRRRKMGFGVPLGRWFAGELRAYVSDVLLPSDAKYRAYLAGPYVEQIVRRHLSGAEDLGHQLWNLVCFERWLQLLPTWKVRLKPETVPRKPDPANATV